MKKYLVILTGWAVSDFVWKPLTSLLEKHYEIILINWDNVLSTDCFVKKVSSILTEKKIKNFSLLGWSLGSLIAIETAISFYSQIENLILISGTLKFVQDEITTYKIGWRREVLDKMIDKLNTNMNETLNKFFKNLFSHSELILGYYKLFNNEVINSKTLLDSTSLINGLVYLKDMDFRKSTYNLNMPVLLVHGDKDIICPYESSEYIHNIIKSSHLVKLKEKGHMPFYTSYRECYEIIIKHIEENDI
ncbi:UNVERIFIED_CONTAM: pimeloyl-[acyl-carrier protein] methyl ester esterase [Acetivibrio alkalicellulosi]